MPMNYGQLETISHKTARVVPVEPQVKSSETCKLFNAGVRGNSKTGKSVDPTCYDALIQWRASCKHSASRFSLRTKHRASVAVGDGSTCRSGASGFASATTWAALLGSRSFNMSGSTRCRREVRLWETHLTSVVPPEPPNRTFGTLTNSRRPRDKHSPTRTLIGRQAPCSIAGSAAQRATKPVNKSQSEYARPMPTLFANMV